MNHVEPECFDRYRIVYSQLNMQVQNAILSSYTDDLEPTRTLKLNAKFLRLYHRANTGLNEQELRLLLEQHRIPVSLADQMELAERIALALEADPNLRIEFYVALAEGILLLRRLFSGVMKKQFGTKVPQRKELLAALAQNLEWIAGGLRGDLGKPPGRLNVELASLANAILAYQKQTPTQVKLQRSYFARFVPWPDTHPDR